jgi:ABC-type multidrug transport system fused ATPase/permease subunit
MQRSEMKKILGKFEMHFLFLFLLWKKERRKNMYFYQKKVNSESISLLFDRSWNNFFSPVNVLLSIVGLTLIYIYLYLRYKRNKEKPYYRFFIGAFTFKVVLVLANALFYIIAYKGGGDSINYWRNAEMLNNLLFENPSFYFQEIFYDNSDNNVLAHFNATTGIPIQDFYNEANAFFVCKIGSIFSFFTFGSYILLEIVFAFITFIASWHLFEMVRSFNLHSDRTIAFAIFGIPSLGFWCSGLSKDTLLFIAICYAFYYLNVLISTQQKSKKRYWFFLLLAFLLMFKIRPFILMAVLAPMFMAYGVRLSNKINRGNIIQFLSKLTFFSVCILAFAFFLQSSAAETFINEAKVVNLDLTNNVIYGNKRYSLGELEFSPIGMVKALPASVLAGIYRPFIWESLNLSLILNGLESLLLLFLTIRFFVAEKFMDRIKLIQKTEFLVFSLFFIILIAYIAGYTSILFGLLVRIRAPLIPFFILLLMVKTENKGLKLN